MSILDSLTDEELQDYICLANLTDCFVRITPENPLHESIQLDILACLDRIRKGGKNGQN